MKRLATSALVAGMATFGIAVSQGHGVHPSSETHVVASGSREASVPVVLDGIPGEVLVDGAHVQRSHLGGERLHELGTAIRPSLPLATNRTLPGGWAATCPCPAASTSESEADCGLYPDGSGDALSDTVNGGCNSTPEVFGTIELGDVVCGTTAWDVNGMMARDLDWYESVLTHETTVTFSVRGDFTSLATIIDGSAGCPGTTVVSDFGVGCDDPATVSATLPPGTYWFIATVDFTSAPVPCGTSYTATLTAGCTFYDDLGAFEATFPSLTLEDFEDLMVVPLGYCGPEPTPWDGTTANSCLNPGELESGLTIDALSSGDAFVLGVGYGGVGNPVDSVQVLAAGGGTSELRFDPPVRRVGLELEHLFLGSDTVGLELEDASGGLIASTQVTVADSTETFWGVACDTPIAILRMVDTTGLLTAYGSIRYGGGGDCEFILDEADFDARFPGLALEDFEDVSQAVPGMACTAPGPWDSTTSNACFLPGEIEPGLILEDAGGPAEAMAFGAAGLTCSRFPLDSNCVVSFGTSVTDLTFDPPVTRIGLELEAWCFPTTKTKLEIYGPGGVLIGSDAFDAVDVPTFWGVACDELIEEIRLVPDETPGIVAWVDNIRFGNAGTVFADAEVFDALYPDLAFEDLEDSNVAPGTGVACQGDPVDSAGDGSVCFDPGDIEPGLTIGSLGVTGLTLLGDGFACGGTGNAVVSSRIAVTEFSETTVLTFTPPVRQAGFDAQSCLAASETVTVTVLGQGGEVLSLESFVADGITPTFFGIVSERAIASIRLSDSRADGAHFDNFRFGTSKLPFTRFCVAESVASANTGLKTTLVLESQDSLEALLPFERSIAGNAAPNRFMMIAKDAPGPGNGGTANIGYFIMGTGASTFVPPGSVGPICVAPGIKRYIGPVSMTSETIVFHDAGGAPTTLVGAGFSRAALGAGAHFIGANIGGTLGFHWSFQAWHRDSPGPSNLSDAVAVDFTP